MSPIDKEGLWLLAGSAVILAYGLFSSYWIFTLFGAYLVGMILAAFWRY